MNQLQSILFAASLHTAPVQPIPMQTYYVANLSATDGQDAGSYYTVYPQQEQPVTPYVIIEKNDSEE